jgi:hypothetical protein
MRTTIALALLGLTAVLASQPASAEELRLRRVNNHRLVIEEPFGGRRGYVRATPSGRLVIENEWGRRVGSVRPLPGGERAIVECAQGSGCLQLAD